MKSYISKIVLGGALGLVLTGASFAQQHDAQRGNDNSSYHFRPEDRDQMKGHYQSKVKQYQGHDNGRAHYSAGQQLSTADVRHFQAVPSTYARTLPPAPRGYRFGYYQGNVVAYNPTTRIIADVMDLVSQ